MSRNNASASADAVPPEARMSVNQSAPVDGGEEKEEEEAKVPGNQSAPVDVGEEEIEPAAVGDQVAAAGEEKEEEEAKTSGNQSPAAAVSLDQVVVDNQNASATGGGVKVKAAVVDQTGKNQHVPAAGGGVKVKAAVADKSGKNQNVPANEDEQKRDERDEKGRLKLEKYLGKCRNLAKIKSDSLSELLFWRVMSTFDGDLEAEVLEPFFPGITQCHQRPKLGEVETRWQEDSLFLPYVSKPMTKKERDFCKAIGRYGVEIKKRVNLLRQKRRAFLFDPRRVIKGAARVGDKELAPRSRALIKAAIDLELWLLVQDILLLRSLSDNLDSSERFNDFKEQKRSDLRGLLSNLEMEKNRTLDELWRQSKEKEFPVIERAFIKVYRATGLGRNQNLRVGQNQKSKEERHQEIRVEQHREIFRILNDRLSVSRRVHAGSLPLMCQRNNFEEKDTPFHLAIRSGIPSSIGVRMRVVVAMLETKQVKLEKPNTIGDNALHEVAKIEKNADVFMAMLLRLRFDAIDNVIEIAEKSGECMLHLRDVTCDYYSTETATNGWVPYEEAVWGEDNTKRTPYFKAHVLNNISTSFFLGERLKNRGSFEKRDINGKSGKELRERKDINKNTAAEYLQLFYPGPVTERARKIAKSSVCNLNVSVSYACNLASFILAIVGEIDFSNPAEECICASGNGTTITPEPSPLTGTSVAKIGIITAECAFFLVSVALAVIGYAEAHEEWVEKSKPYRLGKSPELKDRKSFQCFMSLCLLSLGMEGLGVAIATLLVVGSVFTGNDEADKVLRVGFLTGASLVFAPTGNIIDSIETQSSVYEAASFVVF